jgi:hypothetical protein
MFRRPPDPAVEARCEKLLAALTASPRHWLPLGPFRTRRAKCMYLRAGVLGEWELYEESEDGSFELGMEPHVFRVFEPDGYLRVRARESPELVVEPVREPFASQLVAWDQLARDGFVALLGGRASLRLGHGLGQIVCIDEQLWRVKHEGQALVTIDAMERSRAASASWEATVAGALPLREDAEPLRASVRAALDPMTLLAGVLAARVAIRLADAEERWIYRLDDGSLVAWAPTGEVEIDGYPGCPPFADPVDKPIYAQTPYAMETLVTELHTTGRVEGVAFGRRPGND